VWLKLSKGHRDPNCAPFYQERLEFLASNHHDMRLLSGNLTFLSILRVGEAHAVPTLRGFSKVVVGDRCVAVCAVRRSAASRPRRCLDRGARNQWMFRSRNQGVATLHSYRVIFTAWKPSNLGTTTVERVENVSWLPSHEEQSSTWG
jgi:hypothetical protein